MKLSVLAVLVIVLTACAGGGKTGTRNQVGRAWSTPPVAVKHIYRKPTAAARIVQHKATVAGAGVASPTDLTGTLARRPKAGNLLLAFGSTGFGCVVAPGWTLLGTDPANGQAVAYRVARSDDGTTFVPFTTPRTNGYTLEIVEIAGGPDIIASPQDGGRPVRASTISNTFSLGIPQTGGMLFQLYAGWASEKGGPRSFGSTLPPGQKQSLVDRVPQYHNASELVIQATATDPRNAAQPFTAVQRMTFANHKAPDNTVAGWLVWVGGKTT